MHSHRRTRGWCPPPNEMTPPLPLLHPWLLALPVLFLYLAHFWLRSARMVRAGRLSAAERTRFAIGLAAVMTGYLAATSALESACSGVDIFCLMSLPPRSPCSALLWLLHAGGSTALLAWVWVGNGAALLSRVAPALVRGVSLRAQYTASDIRLVVTVVVPLTLAVAVAIGIRIPAQFGLTTCAG